MAYGEDFDAVFHDAIVYPPAAVLAENLSVLRTSYAGEGLYAKLGICWKHRGCLGCIVSESDGVLGVEVDGNVVNRTAEAYRGSLGPVRKGIHQATLRFFCELAPAVLWSLASFFRSASIMRLTSS